MIKKITNAICYAGCIALVAVCGRAVYKIHKGENPIEVLNIPGVGSVVLTKENDEEENDYDE